MDKEKKSAKTYSNPTSLEKLIKENKPTEPKKEVMLKDISQKNLLSFLVHSRTLQHVRSAYIPHFHLTQSPNLRFYFESVLPDPILNSIHGFC